MIHEKLYGTGGLKDLHPSGMSDTKQGYHPLYRNMTIPLSSQHPKRDILEHPVPRTGWVRGASRSMGKLEQPSAIGFKTLGGMT